MVELRRTVRVVINPPGSPPTPGRNGYAGKPAPAGLPRYYEFDVLCRGEPDPVTGYLVDIKAVDKAFRGSVVPLLERACAERPLVEAADLLPEFVGPLRAALEPVHLRGIRWRLLPRHALEIHTMPESDRRVLVRQRFDFAAAHRLHVPSLTAEENRAAFGKCNNESGHGHNYQFEPAIAVPPGSTLTPAEVERLAEEAILARFDHTHLNEDTAEFRTGEGVNPSVENIARVFFELLEPRVKQADPGADLVSMTVWETDRTSSTYPAA